MKFLRELIWGEVIFRDSAWLTLSAGKLMFAISDYWTEHGGISFRYPEWRPRADVGYFLRLLFAGVLLVLRRIIWWEFCSILLLTVMVVKMYFVLLHSVSQILYIPYMIIQQSIPRQPVIIFPKPFRQLRVLATCFFWCSRAHKKRRPTVHRMVQLWILLLFYCLLVILVFCSFNIVL